MRITGGSSKGRMLASAGAGKGVRPTGAKVRQALFNILREGIVGAAFLDLYAGSGAVGFEALSRGAAWVCFVDKDPAAIDNIKRYPPFCSTPNNQAIVAPAAEALKKFAIHSETFDVVYVDPPYNSDEIDITLPLIGTGSVLKKDAVVIVEHPSRRSMSEISERLTLKRSYRYGDTMLSVYRL
ncbi:16S rRNA (guanine(966)-N(2))-methyltransferase RsmD [Candidatus Magnetobacterium casense]|uniref:16S rRNA (guanine(966)-N(2))-methyltransferase RsmD n=1 Tax=Candidatus Magnetobacterium casense TaxID=1455061 RepID=UPI00058B2559|nr:16S rRNA (guanine(966)-N(2))-methyltransferase RsmD [Candidatus Magnetobacterium casensis]